MVGAEDEAAFPARAPPAVQPARGEHPVAHHRADVAAVRAQRLVVVRIGDDSGAETRGEDLTGVLHGAFELTLLSRHAGEAAQGHGLHGAGEAALGGPLAGNRGVGHGGLHASEGAGDVGRQGGDVALSAEIARHLAPGHGPGGERRADYAGVGEQLEVGTQTGVARGGPGIGGGGVGGAGQRDQASGSERVAAYCGQPASPAARAPKPIPRRAERPPKKISLSARSCYENSPAF